MRTIKVNWEGFLSNIDLLHNDKPLVVKNFIHDVDLLLSWQEVENVLNKNECKWMFLDNQESITVPTYKTEWSKELQDKEFIHYLIKRGKTFSISEYSCHNQHTKFLSSEVERIFEVVSDLHVYGSTSSENSSFPIHYDFPYNFIIQCDGSCDWVVYKTRASGLIKQPGQKGLIDPSKLEKEIQVKLEPGDMLYIPSMQFHAAFPNSPRLSLSIPCKPGNRGRINKKNYKL